MKVLETSKKRVRINIHGRVQGVGFRPTVYRYAKERNLSGWVSNTSSGVVIEIEGISKKIDDFIHSLKSSPPPQAEINNLEIYPIESETFGLLGGEERFKIRESIFQTETKTQISPDIATCQECLEELLNPEDRRYFYPFLNCTNCGPRFTICKGIPYDRKKTTMEKFVMCPQCLEEYKNPLNRRFHAQPNACPECGPEVQLIKNNNTHVGQGFSLAKKEADLKGLPYRSALQNNAIKKTIELLKQGKIVAIKGLGGFHLACEAQNSQAVDTLRKRKYREDKPFALMAKDIETIKQFCEVSIEEEKLLLSSKRPIVLLKKKNLSKSTISEHVAPGNKYLGFILPYTPLHYLLFNSQLSILVMTSGNISDEPIAYENEEAIQRLKNIADYFLIHNRDIYIRCDDSVTRIFNNREMIIRRSRGYVPEPIKSQKLKVKSQKAILACGAHLKNTFCLAKNDNIFISHHIGDLENAETLSAFEKGIEHFKEIFHIQPEIIVHDLHPEYLSTKYANTLQSINPKLRAVAVQHHHAHIASCLADNQKDTKVIGVAFDGTGYGDDGNIWGGEFLIADFNDYKRVAHLKYMPMPGGEKAIKEPWRMTAGLLYQAYGKDFLKLDIDFLHRLDKKKWKVLQKMIDQKINTPFTSSAGRLFDAVSSLIGIRDEINYEGQAAVELEQMAEESQKSKIKNQNYSYLIKEENGSFIIDSLPMFKEIIGDSARFLGMKISKSTISARFHITIAKMIVETCLKIRKNSGLNEVALSGGVFQNMILLNSVYHLLKKEDFIVYTHSKVPPNDGGISLGQAKIGTK